MATIHPEAPQFVDAIIDAGYTLQRGRVYHSIINDMGKTQYKLWPNGYLEWFQYGAYNRVKIGKRLAHRLIRELETRKEQNHEPT